MGISTARRVRDQVREGLAELIRLVNDPATPTGDVRDVLSGTKALGAQVSILQADAAAVVAARERHGDSGVGVLAQAAGLSRREAVGQVQTAERLQSMPGVRDAVEAGRISVANAKTLARASGQTSAAQVDGDAELLEKAAELSPEQFAREAGWAQPCARSAALAGPTVPTPPTAGTRPRSFRRLLAQVAQHQFTTCTVERKSHLASWK